jgi:hypothetical protein
LLVAKAIFGFFFTDRHEITLPTFNFGMEKFHPHSFLLIFSTAYFESQKMLSFTTEITHAIIEKTVVKSLKKVESILKI